MLGFDYLFSRRSVEPLSLKLRNLMPEVKCGFFFIVLRQHFSVHSASRAEAVLTIILVA